MNYINVKNMGAQGDGIQDDSTAIQSALDIENIIVYIPKGTYRIVNTLKIGSNTSIIADSAARLFHCASFPKKRGDFLISNKDIENGNCHISITGGIWDGNFDGKNNTKNPNLFDKEASSGATMNFVNVKGLELQDLTVANSITYFIRMCKLEDFKITDIRFSAEQLTFNQDGLHFQGETRNGVVENIRAITNGETNDDMIALNADDSLERLENLDMICGTIENITFKNIYAENCYSAIRMLSVRSAIRNITFENIYAGCRTYAINMDAARYCRTPLFDEKDYPQGVGRIENIHIKNFKFFSTNPQGQNPLICDETLAKNFVIENIERVYDKDLNPDLPTAKINNVSSTIVRYTENNKPKNIILDEVNDVLLINGNITTLRIDHS